MPSTTDLARLFASAGFRVSRIHEAPTEPEQAACARAAGQRALEKHQKRVAAYVAAFEASQRRADTAAMEGPTEARRLKGVFACMAIEGARVEVDLHASRLDQMCEAGQITKAQCQGGHDFAALMDRMRMVPAMRSCLDDSPRGFTEDSEPSHHELRDAAERKQLHAACGALVWSELRRTCVDQCAPRSLDRLRLGLDACVELWG